MTRHGSAGHGTALHDVVTRPDTLTWPGMVTRRAVVAWRGVMTRRGAVAWRRVAVPGAAGTSPQSAVPGTAGARPHSGQEPHKVAKSGQGWLRVARSAPADTSHF